ncbi:MAG: molybdopterin biosynthesis protein [Methanospirillum sp.]|nr:molybdopterin biosynthesis protein [Methanospirillum sp.]
MVKRYLAVVSLEEALEVLGTGFTYPRPSETVPLEEAVGRVTVAPVHARFSVPEVHLSAMDGIAVRAAETAGASEGRPVRLLDALRVNTGNVVPPPYDAVIMIEDVLINDDGTFTIRKAAAPWQHVRPAGEDIGETEMVVPRGRRLRAEDLGALAAYGLTGVEVATVRVGFVPTGSELVPHGRRPEPGQVVESNTLFASAWLASLGCRCTRFPNTPDEYGLIRDRIREAVAVNDLVIVSAGSSAGTRDYTADVVAELGEVLVHGVAIKPGKPVIIGRVDGKPVIGLPGYPLSALTVLREIVLPVLARFGLPSPAPEEVEAVLASPLTKEVGSDEFVLLAIGRVGDRWVAIPQSRGAGVQMAVVRSNAYLRVPARTEGLEAGAEVPVRLSVPRSEAERALLVTGSHDPAVDVLADLLSAEGIDLHSAHVGSTGGIFALRRGHCHAAPMHLLAPDGDFNIPFLRQYLPGQRVLLVCVAERQQGIISRDGLGIEAITGHAFANRQRGSGTRMLLDRWLDEHGVEPARVRGYDREFTTHLGVAVAVKSGEAEMGLGVYSAAQALGLAFAPVATERYELALDPGSLQDPRVSALVDAISSDAFRARLEALGGYDLTFNGERRFSLP